jgi:hypothetical protein
MRLKTELWVKAYLRTCAAAGLPAVVVHHGDDDAGAIFIKIARLDGTARLFGPAPASLDAEPIGTDRRFTPHLDGDGVTEADIEAYLARQLDFDRDLWVVEVEDRQGRHCLDLWLRS